MARKIYENSLKYNLKMEDVANENNVDLIDVVKSFSSIREYLFLDPLRDTIHPNAKGHAVIAQLVVNKMSVLLKK